MTISIHWIDCLDEKNRLTIQEMLLASIEHDDGVLGFGESDRDLVDSYLDGLKDRIESKAALVLHAHEDDKSISILVLERRVFPNMRHIGELAKAFVLPKYRGRHGLIKDGLRATLIKSSELGIDKLIIDVREGTRSAILWEALGFKTYGVMEDYSRCNGKVHRGSFMQADVQKLLKLYVG